MILTGFLLFWALGVSGACFWIQRRRSQESGLVKELRGVPVTDLPIRERVDLLHKIAIIKRHEAPWFERSLSTVGVVVFFSMLIATAIQTASATREAIEAERLRQGVKELESQRSVAESLLSDFTKAVVAQYRQSGRVDPVGEQLLRHRLDQLQALTTRSRVDVVEEFELSLIVGDFKRALALVEKDADLLNTTDPADTVSLAEYHYIDGADGSARDLLQTLDARLSSLPTSLRIRVIVLNAV
jgi:hypothetical protein